MAHRGLRPIDAETIDFYVAREEDAIVIEKLKDQGVVLIIGEAGSGKTSTINKICYEEEAKGNLVVKLSYGYDIPPSRLTRDLINEISELAEAIGYVREPSEVGEDLLAKLNLASPAGEELIGFLQELLSLPIGKLAVDGRTPKLRTSDIHPVVSKITMYDAAELLKQVCDRIGGKLIYVVIDDLRFVPKDDKDKLFDLIFNIRPALGLDKIRFLLGWRTSLDRLKEEASEFVERDLFVELGELPVESVMEIAKQFGLSISDEVKYKIWDLTLGRPSLCVMLFNTLRRSGVEIVDEEVIRRVPESVRELYEIYLRQYDPWAWALESLALVGEHPDQLNALNYVARNVFGKGEPDLYKALEKLTNKVIKLDNRRNRYIFNHETIREHLHENSMMISRGRKAHRLLASYYKGLCDKMLEHGVEPPVDYIEAVAYHAGEGVASEADIELMELDLWACSRLAKYYFEYGNPFECLRYSRRMYERARLLGYPARVAEAVFYTLRYAWVSWLPLDEVRGYIEEVRRIFGRCVEEGSVGDDLLFYYCLSEYRYVMYLVNITHRSQVSMAEDEMREALENMRSVMMGGMGSLMRDRARWLELKLRLSMAEFLLYYMKRDIQAAEEAIKKWRGLLEESWPLRKVSERTYLRLLAMFYNAAGRLYLMKGDFEEAIRCFDEGMDCYERAGFLYGVGISLRRKIVAMLNKGLSEQELLEAWEMIIKAIDMARRAMHVRGVISRTRLKSLIDLALSDIDSAVEESRRAMEMVRRSKDPLYAAYTELNHALVLLAKHMNDVDELRRLKGILNRVRGVLEEHDCPQRHTPRILDLICSHLLGEIGLDALLEGLRAVREEISRDRFFMVEKALSSLMEAIEERGAVDEHVLRRVAIRLLTPGITRVGP